MNAGHFLLFPPFRLDPVNQRLWRGTQEIPLRQKTFAVLRYLAEHSNQLVTKEALLDAIWAETCVSDVVLTVCIRELRRALGDDRKTPLFIVTVHGRGYRFLPTVTTQPVASSQFSVVSTDKTTIQNPQLATGNWQLTTHLVGRETELVQLHSWWEKALNGERQIVFVSGEAGIGKTSVVEAFLQTLDLRRRTLDANLWIGRGQCIEHHGAGEGYMPVLEALGRLCREPEGERLMVLLERYAPTWLAQMPALLSAAKLEVLQRKVLGATRERMLREMAEAIEALTAELPLVLRLEDLHWSDHSTLELLSVLARRREAARLLVLGTYRPVEVLANGHPLRAVTQELQLHQYCHEMPLQLLSEGDIVAYLTARLPVGVHGRVPLQKLARLLHQRTEGNPLFMVNVMEEWLARGEFDSKEVGVSTPTTLRQMIERQFDHLSPEEQQVLAVASVAGMEFSAAVVAAGIEASIPEVEGRCANLVRQEHFLRASGASEWPDGTVAARYSFLHALYQEVIYERVTAGQRQQLHKRIGEREEQAYGKRAREIAAELAVHFERGQDYYRAIRYLQQAGENALQRVAYQEALQHFTKGLELLKTLPDTPERVLRELRLQVSLSAPLVVVKGWSAPEVKSILDRAWELCQQIGETQPSIPVVLAQLAVFHLVRGELQRARELVKQYLSLAQREHNRALILRASLHSGQVALYLGEFSQARAHAEKGILLCKQFDFRAFIHMQDPELDCLHYAAQALWYLGYPDQARQYNQAAVRLAKELAHPFGLAISLTFAAQIHSLHREWSLMQAQAEEAITITTEQAFPVYLAIGLYSRGWALAEQGQFDEGLAQMQQGITAFRATGAGLALAWRQAGLAQVYGKMGQPETGLRALAEALEIVTTTDERYHEAEIYRLKGELTLQQFQVSSSAFQVQTSQKAKGKTQNPALNVVEGAKKPSTQQPTPSSQAEAEAEACLRKAIEIARRQSAKSWELRATTSLARLWQQQGKMKQACKMLAEIYGWFTEGFDTADLKEAKALLTELS